MSRIGNKIIEIPEGVKVIIDNNHVKVTGPKGELEIPGYKGIEVSKKETVITVTRSSDERKFRAMHGTIRQLIANAIEGVSIGFKKDLEIKGVGYQANMQGDKLHLQLGYSHDIYFVSPDNVNISANRTEISVSGCDKQLVGEVASKIRSFRKPEPYKGKGILYKGEVIRRKAGKSAAK